MFRRCQNDFIFIQERVQEGTCDDPEMFDDNPVRFLKRFDDNHVRFPRRFERRGRWPTALASLLSF